MSAARQEDAQGQNGRFWTLFLVGVVVLCVFMCAIMALFFNPLEDRLRTDPSAKLTGHSFTNPYELSATRNGGGWALQLEQVIGPRVDLSDLIIAVRAPSEGGNKGTTWRLNVRGTGANSSNLALESPVSRWYLRANDTTTVPLRFANGSAPANLNLTSAPQLRDEFMPTVEGAIMLFKDTDRNGNMTDGDKLWVYKDIDADGRTELGPGTLIELQTTDGKLITSVIFK